ncbi:hypothetical protein GCM10012279_16950 [Micromonospora yangpuensis]|nr:hypothetical protein GCM10012279_16950 [Micromonospora yangpuensis]
MLTPADRHALTPVGRHMLTPADRHVLAADRHVLTPVGRHVLAAAQPAMVRGVPRSTKCVNRGPFLTGWGGLR